MKAEQLLKQFKSVFTKQLTHIYQQLEYNKKKTHHQTNINRPKRNRKTTAKTNPYKYSGPYNIPRIFKKCPVQLAPRIIMQKSLDSG